MEIDMEYFGMKRHGEELEKPLIKKQKLPSIQISIQINGKTTALTVESSNTIGEVKNKLNGLGVISPYSQYHLIFFAYQLLENNSKLRYALHHQAVRNHFE